MTRPRSVLLAVLPLLVACATSRDAAPSARAARPLRFDHPGPWAAPIADYLAAGTTHFPDGFNRAITALQAFDGRLWIGYGDGTVNMGTRVPIELRSFASPDDPRCTAARVLAEGQGAPQRTPTDTGEEQIEPYRVCDGALWQAGVDSNDPDEAWTQAKGPERVIEGNAFELEGDAWRKRRSIPGGEHVHDLAWFDGGLWAVGSGAADRAEFESGRVFRYLWRSDDGGATFAVVRRVMYEPENAKPFSETSSEGDTRFRRLLPVAGALYVFGYVNPYVDGGPLEGRHLRVTEDGSVAELGGAIGPLVVQRTYPLPDGTGLAVARDADGCTRTFRARSDALEELRGWAAARVIDVAPAPDDNQVLVLCGDGGTPERFTVHTALLDELDALLHVVDVPVEPSALALWHDDLFVGTQSGEVWRARRASRP